jgi:hypothetical protein
VDRRALASPADEGTVTSVLEFQSPPDPGRRGPLNALGGDDVLGADNVTSARRADAAWFASHPDLAQLIPNAISS